MLNLDKTREVENAIFKLIVGVAQKLETPPLLQSLNAGPSSALPGPRPCSLLEKQWTWDKSPVGAGCRGGGRGRGAGACRD